MKIPLPSHFGAFALTGLMVVLPAAVVTTMFAQQYYCDPTIQDCSMFGNQNTQYNPYLTNPNLRANQDAYNDAFNNFYTQYLNQQNRQYPLDNRGAYNPATGEYVYPPSGNQQRVMQPTDQSWLQRSSVSSMPSYNYGDPVYPPYGENGTPFGYPYQGQNPYQYGYVGSSSSRSHYRQGSQRSSISFEEYRQNYWNVNMQVQYLSQERYMKCMQDVVQRREQDVQDVYGDYHRQHEQLLLERSRERVITWQITDSGRRRDRERQVERDFRERFRDLERWLDDREDDIEDAYRNDSRECDRVRKEMERQERDQERELERAYREGNRVTY